jgi:hypothetical protein
MSTRNLPGSKGRPVHKANNFTAIYQPIVLKMWEPQRLAALWASKACYRDSFTFYLFYVSLQRIESLKGTVIPTLESIASFPDPVLNNPVIFVNLLLCVSARLICYLRCFAQKMVTYAYAPNVIPRQDLSLQTAEDNARH